MEYGMTHEIRSTHEEERGTHLSYHKLYTHYAPCPPESTLAEACNSFHSGTPRSSYYNSPPHVTAP